MELEEATLSDTPNSAENIDNMTILDQFSSDIVMDTTEMEIDGNTHFFIILNILHNILLFDIKK